jgi:hypothetical protein
MNQSININELTIEQLAELKVSLSVQLAEAKLNEMRVVTALDAIGSVMLQHQQEQAKATTLTLPKLQKLNLPTLKKV